MDPPAVSAPKRGRESSGLPSSYKAPNPTIPGGGHGNPLQYSRLRNPHGQRSLEGYSPWACKSQTQLSDQTTTTSPIMGPHLYPATSQRCVSENHHVSISSSTGEHGAGGRHTRSVQSPRFSSSPGIPERVQESCWAGALGLEEEPATGTQPPRGSFSEGQDGWGHRALALRRLGPLLQTAGSKKPATLNPVTHYMDRGSEDQRRQGGCPKSRSKAAAALRPRIRGFFLEE